LNGPEILDENKVKEILNEAHNKKIIQVDFENESVSQPMTAHSTKTLKYFKDLLRTYIDTYFIVA